MDKDNIYIFNNKDLEYTSLLHPSKKRNLHFQRFEFLGDKLVSETLTKWIIYNKDYDEKQMSLWLTNLICADTMNNIGHFLVPYIQYTGIINKNIVCDSLESWIGAIYLDAGDYHSVILGLWDKLLHIEYSKSYTNLLQELCHRHNILVHESWVKDNNIYTYSMSYNNYSIQQSNVSKKTASYIVHEKMYYYLCNILSN